MRISARLVLFVLALAVAVTVVGRASTSSSARSEVQLELGELLLADERYWEAIPVFDRAKDGANPQQALRASSGLLRSLLLVAEFGRAYEETLVLGSMDPQDPELRALYADGLWAYGLFAEAEQTYDEILAVAPSSPRALHGLGRSLAAQSRFEEGLVEVQAAIAGAPDTAEYHHTLGSIHRRLRQFDQAAEAFDRFVELVSNVQYADKSEWARSQARYLRSFADREPLVVEGGDELHRVPFRLVNDKVVLDGRINGNPPIDIVVDTGAEQMVLSQETAADVGVRPVVSTVSAGVGEVGLRGLDLGRADSLEIGSLRVNNLPAIIKNPPLTGLPESRVQNSISPLAFGLSTRIDYQNNELVMARSLPETPADIVMPMRVHRLAVVRGVVNGRHPKSFVVDTGGEVISISLGTANVIETQPPRRIPLKVFGTSGWDQDAFLLPGVDLAFDAIEYPNYSVVVLNLHRPSALLGFQIGGIIGHRFLREYDVTMDLERSQLRLNRF